MKKQQNVQNVMYIMPHYVKVLANSSENIPIPGSYVRVHSCSADFTLKTDIGHVIEHFNEGRSLRSKNGEWSGLTVVSDTTQEIVLYIGTAEYNDDSFIFSGAIDVNLSSALTSTADKVLLNAAITTVIAANASRKAVTIKNLSTNPSIIRVGGATTAAAIGHELLPGESVTFNTTGAVYAYAPAAGNSVSIVEE